MISVTVPVFNYNGKLCRKGQWDFVKHLVYVKARAVSPPNSETAAVYQMKRKRYIFGIRRTPEMLDLKVWQSANYLWGGVLGGR